MEMKSGKVQDRLMKEDASKRYPGQLHFLFELK